MDNLNKIKFKETEAPNWYYKIDLEDGSQISFANGKGSGSGLYKEMQAWVNAGNTIEPQYTPEELEQKEAAELQTALTNQKNKCIRLLNDSEKAVSNDPPYPDDVSIWVNVRAQWRSIIQSDQIEAIPDKPF